MNQHVDAQENELVRFDRAEEYMLLLSSLVSSPRLETLQSLTSILEDYQDQSYLLDPFLSQMVLPPISALQSHTTGTPSPAISLLSRLIYTYTKIRGYKTITTFFPHQVPDLVPTLIFLETQGPSQTWETRYVLLLWLSLVCMIPFDLSQFEHTTALRLEEVGRIYIQAPGKERDAAAVMLGKLYQRKDVYDHQFERFTAFCAATLVSNPTDFAATGILQTLCEIVKTSDPQFVNDRLLAIQAVLDLYDSPDLTVNGLVTKHQTKLTYRIGLKLLRPRQRRRFICIKTLSGSTDPEQEQDEDEQDVPIIIDTYVSRLLDALQHKDTIVRYSAAKGLARLCERLPKSFIVQVSDAVISLFSINVPQASDDLSAVSEYTWQGACMALAEKARRGLLFAPPLHWIRKALLFDVRRGSHSVGSSVRDAACYVIWAMARSHDAQAIHPFALDLARDLLCVATLDREISIRRAASAAFQECVGRLDLFPHGIEVIRMTDFYAVSVRKNAYLICAVNVARLKVYREAILAHLLIKVTHWDVSVRRVAAKSIALIVGEGDVRPTVEELAQMCKGRDSTVLHGALLSLAEIAAFTQDKERCLEPLATMPLSSFKTLGASLVLQASCLLLTACSSLLHVNILHLSLARQEDYVQSAAAEAVGRRSLYSDVTDFLIKATEGWTSLTIAEGQSYALVLGAVQYSPNWYEKAVRQLCKVAKESQNVETRRNAASSLGRVISSDLLTPPLTEEVLHTLLGALQDYTQDARGDVGSWIRLASISSLSTLAPLLSPSQLTPVLGGILKQSVERIDSLRSIAGGHLLQLFSTLKPPGHTELLTALSHEPHFDNPNWLFPRVVPLLNLTLYRPFLLEGLITSLAGKSEMGISDCLVSFALSSPLEAHALLTELYELAKRHFASTRFFVPVIKTISVLLEGGVLDSVDDKVLLARILRITSNNIVKIKAVQRVNACAIMVVNLLPSEAVRAQVLDALKEFLAHPFPTSRAAASEHLYMVLQLHDLPLPSQAEQLLLNTPWSRVRRGNFASEAEKVVRLLS